jgi:hypothetical protein
LIGFSYLLNFKFIFKSKFEVMPLKRKKSSNKEKESNVKVRRVIIDSDEEDDETLGKMPVVTDNENLKQQQLTTNEMDEVVSEVC